MPIEVTMPKFGLTMQEGTLQRYFRASGDGVNAGEPLYEVETEKVLYVVEAPEGGALALWLHDEGAVVECGGLVAVIAQPDEDLAAVRNQYAGHSVAGGLAQAQQQEQPRLVTASAGQGPAPATSMAE